MNMENKELLNNAKDNARKRIIALIQEYCSGSQQRFVERTGLNKGAVSQYVNGKKSPTNLAAQTIGHAFNVSPAWVMGFNVPKTGDNVNAIIEDSDFTNYIITHDEVRLLEAYRAADPSRTAAINILLDLPGGIRTYDND